MTKKYIKTNNLVELKLMLALAKQGNNKIQYYLGIIFKHGIYGYKKDYKKSSYWLLEAVKNGHRYAMLELAENYYKGLGVNKNTALADKFVEAFAIYKT